MDFRDSIDALRKAGQLVEVDRPVDIRYLGTLVEETDKALLFNNIPGYDMPFIAGILIMIDRPSMEATLNERAAKLANGECPIVLQHMGLS